MQLGFDYLPICASIAQTPELCLNGVIDKFLRVTCKLSWMNRQMNNLKESLSRSLLSLNGMLTHFFLINRLQVMQQSVKYYNAHITFRKQLSFLYLEQSPYFLNDTELRIFSANCNWRKTKIDDIYLFIVMRKR